MSYRYYSYRYTGLYGFIVVFPMLRTVSLGDDMDGACDNIRECFLTSSEVSWLRGLSTRTELLHF